MVNRKLIRPNLAEIKGKLATKPLVHDHHPREGNGGHPRRRLAPQDHTSAEAFYYLKQMNAKTPMVVVLTDGEEVHGVIEWYDRTCIKINREGAPNLLVLKHCIKYMYNAEEGNGSEPSA